MRKTFISVLLCLCASIIYPSCEKSSMDKMQLLYNESMGLKDVGIDSIRAFSRKVNDYVAVNPSEIQIPCTPRFRAISNQQPLVSPSKLIPFGTARLNIDFRRLV